MILKFITLRIYFLSGIVMLNMQNLVEILKTKWPQDEWWHSSVCIQVAIIQIWKFKKKESINNFQMYWINPRQCGNAVLFCSHLLICLDDLNDVIINLPPQKLLGLTAVINRVEKHQLHAKLPQPGDTSKKKHNVWSNTHETQHRCFWSHCLDCCAVSAHDIMSRWWEDRQWERQQILQNWSQEWWQCDMMKWCESRLEMDMMSCFGGSTNKQSMLRVAWAISSELAESWGTGYTFYLLSGEMSPGTPLVKYQKIGTGVWNDGSKFEVAGCSRRQFVQLMGWRAVQAKTHKK